MSRAAALRTKAAPAPAPEPTAEQLQLAFRHLSRPNLWPSTVEECLRKPHFAAALRALALRMHRGGIGQPNGAKPQHSLPTGVPVPPTPQYPLPLPPRPAQACAHLPGPGHWVCRPSQATADRKRLAANDKD